MKYMTSQEVEALNIIPAQCVPWVQESFLIKCLVLK